MSSWRSIAKAATRKRAKHSGKKRKKPLRGGLSKSGGYRTYDQKRKTTT